MKNKRIWKRTERELKRNLIIGFTSGIMVYGITSLGEIIGVIFVGTGIVNNIGIEIIMFIIKIVIVLLGFIYGVNFIQKMDLIK